MIRFEQFSFSYEKSKRNQLNDVDLTIQPGEFVLLCGKSACGKTTATKCINGLIPHFTQGKVKGAVWVKERKVEFTPTYLLAQQVGSVFQNPKTQFFNLDSDSELVFGLENLGTPPEEIRNRVDTTVEELNIKNLQGRSVFALSGGEKQILALASVYAVNPDIYVLDEPTANIDEQGMRVLHDILMKLKMMGKTVVISEHRLYFMMDLIDRAVYIDGGVIRQLYSGDEFRAMTDPERIRLGLRCFSKPESRRKEAAAVSLSGRLTVRNLGIKSHGKVLMEGISFSAEPGDIIAVTGENGSGKSSLLRILCGLLKENSGEIFYFGKHAGIRKRRSLCYMTMQDVVHQLFGDSVREEFMLLNGELQPQRIQEILGSLDLAEVQDRHPMTLSGGQRQRLVLAVAAISDKPILLLDEPTSGLDYENMCRVSQLIREISRDKIIFIATNDLELVNMTCTREIELCGDTAKLMDLK